MSGAIAVLPLIALPWQVTLAIPKEGPTTLQLGCCRIRRRLQLERTGILHQTFRRPALIRQLLRTLRIRPHSTLRIGLDDPAQTGILYGRLCALALPLRIEPVFTGTAFALHLQGRFIPLRILWSLLAYSFSPFSSASRCSSFWAWYPWKI